MLNEPCIITDYYALQVDMQNYVSLCTFCKAHLIARKRIDCISFVSEFLNKIAAITRVTQHVPKRCS